MSSSIGSYIFEFRAVCRYKSFGDTNSNSRNTAYIGIDSTNAISYKEAEANRSYKRKGLVSNV